jgi:hypothetical protein
MENENLFNLLLFYKEHLMREFLIDITSKNPTQENFAEKDLVQYNLIRKDKFNPTVLAHQFLLQNLFDFAFFHFLETENQYLKIYNFDFCQNKILALKTLEQYPKMTLQKF